MLNPLHLLIHPNLILSLLHRKLRITLDPLLLPLSSYSIKWHLMYLTLNWHTLHIHQIGIITWLKVLISIVESIIRNTHLSLQIELILTYTSFLTDTKNIIEILSWYSRHKMNLNYSKEKFES